jgi:hypothetical protein
MKVFVLVSILSWGSGCTGLVAQGAKTSAIASSEQSSCSLFNPQPKQIKAVDDSVLLDAYNSQVHLIRSLYVAAMVSGGSGKDHEAANHARELPGIINLVKPDLIRVTGVLRLTSSRGFEMTSDGHEFSLLVPEDDKKVFLVGPADAPAKSKVPRENLRPQPFLDALRWQEGKLRAPAGPEQTVNTATRILEIQLPPSRRGARTAKVEFDVRSGVVNSLAAYGDAGQLIYKAQYRGWKEMKTFSEKGPMGCFPRGIHLVRPDDDYELNLIITEIALNPDIPLSTFRPSPPRGIPIVPVDMLGNIGKAQ